MKRIEELEGEREIRETDVDEAETAYDECDEDNEPAENERLGNAYAEAKATLEGWDQDNGEELKALKAFQEELEGYCDDWRHGTTLIRDDYWPEYAEQLTQELGGLPRDTPPWLVIDWAATAENLKADYTSGEFDGVTYWGR